MSRWIGWYDRWWWTLWPAGIVAVIVGVTIFVFSVTENRECVRDTPWRVKGGYIWTFGGMFASETGYYLWYAGHWEGSDERCQTAGRVTEAEYDRQMYAGAGP